MAKQKRTPLAEAICLLEKLHASLSPRNKDGDRLAHQIHAILKSLCDGGGVSAIEIQLRHLAAQGEKIMSQISDFAAKQNAFNTRIGTSIDNVVSDIAALNAKIEQLQNTPGAITPEDQALLDQIEAQADALATKADALDALTPPTPPVS